MASLVREKESIDDLLSFRNSRLESNEMIGYWTENALRLLAYTALHMRYGIELILRK